MKLYIVATPIGNLKDITLRALEILKSVPLIICEDTRTSQKLLRAYEIESRLESYHQHSKPEKVKYILDLLDEVGEAALITDAGTPGISDPGNMLISEAVKKFGEGCQIIPIPGPSAIVAALSISGFPTDKFSFFGFMPHKKGKETTIKNILNNKETSIFYESTHRIIKTLEKIKEFDHKRQIIVCRELTKKFETVYRGTVEEVLYKIETGNSKGEFVVVVHS
jgi:16S rRNA (cytidine1402-2'-O)-methyltransferase